MNAKFQVSAPRTCLPWHQRDFWPVRCGILLAVVLAAFLSPGYAEDVPPTPWQDGSTTLAVLPDTQYYSEKYPWLFEAQTKWIAAQREKRNIAYALHLGDITESNVAGEWEAAQKALRMLDGKVPYALLPGNHDYTQGRDSLLSKYFPPADFQKWQTFGGLFDSDKLDNNYHLFDIGKRKWIAVCVEFGPRDEVLDWVNKVLDKHPDRLALIVTHAYLYHDNTRFDNAAGVRLKGVSPGRGNDGEQMWQKVVRKHANVMFVLSGHVASVGLGYRTDAGDHGNTVHQIMVDYQKSKQGGQGYLRLLEFLPDGQTVQAKSYSPALDRYKTDPGNQFSLTLKEAPREPLPASK